MEARERKFAGSVFSGGSALILTVVLTGMLAIVGVLFVMMARVDKVATSAISENRELGLAAETVIARISQELVSDIPGVAGQEYYDYPDPCNVWLASLEPYEFAASDYRWRQISDVYKFFGSAAWDLPAVVVPDYQDPCIGFELFADADGDGVADSRWVIIPNMSSSKGKPIYAAIRVVDNEAMLNVNTAWKFGFDPNVPVDANQIDGSSQMQINLAALSQRGFANGTLAVAADNLQILRCGSEPVDLSLYQQNVIWRYQSPNGAYTPFDIVDELKLRNRYILLNDKPVYTRIGELWTKAYNWGLDVPRNNLQHNIADPCEWFWRVNNISPDPDQHDYRHNATTYNLDRIIDPGGGRMVNVNNGNVPFDIPYERYTRLFPFYPLDMNTPVGILYDRLLNSYERLLSSLGPVIPDPNIVTQYAQLAANMVDFSDDDDIDNDGVLDFNCVTTLVDPYGIVHNGFEAQPFITEIAWKIGASPPVTPNYFALELYNPFNAVIDLNDFVLEFVNRNNPADKYYITFPQNVDGTPIVWINPDSYCVIVNEAGRFNIYTDPNKPTTIRVDQKLKFFGSWISSEDKSKPPVDRRPDPDKSKPPIPQGRWGDSYDVFLQRKLLVPPVGTIQWIYVDKQPIEPNRAGLGSILALGRDDRDWRVIYYLELKEDNDPGGSLGMANYFHTFLGPFSIHDFSFFLPNPLAPRAEFITVGDIPRILTLGHGYDPTHNSTDGRQLTIGQQLLETELLQANTAVDQEHRVRLDLRNPYHRNVLQYLTVFDPTRDFIDNDSDGLGTDRNGNGFLDSNEIDFDEVKIPGRININTAPWYVIAQMPWMTNEIALAIVAYRDKLGIPVDYRDPLPPALPTGRYNAIIANSPLNDDFAANFAPWTVREQPGFASIGELNFIIAGLNNFNIAQHAIDGVELPGFPDLTTRDDDPPFDLGDEVIDDFEERDVIFSRISNLVSVRSDVFTAYILVRIGADGPQKRVIAILDRSGVNKTNFRSPDGKVRIVSLHYVPDPR